MRSGSYSSPPPYDSIYPHPTSSENSPLLTRTRKRRWSPIHILGAIMFAVFLAQNFGLVRCPLNDMSAAEKAELRRQWRREVAAHQVEVDIWARERSEHAAETREWNNEREAFAREREEWQRQREEEERHRLEVKRRSQGVHWTEPSADAHCHSYGTRTYTAYLRDIPGDLNWLEVCDNMPPVVIHGRELSKPDKCERNGGGDVVGVWYVDFDEPNCRPYWERLYDKGCSAGQTGVRRFEARLDGIGKGDNWEMMCATTPATINGFYFAHPSSCENRGVWSGMVGIWDYPNRRCP